MENLLLLSDSYKASHSKIYDAKLQYMQSYFESRSEDEQIKFFGLQPIIQKYLSKPITWQDVEQAKVFWDTHFGRKDVFDYDGWMYIVKELDGRLPIRIHAVKEGGMYPSRTPLIVVESTDEKVPFVVNYVEGLLSQVWYPTTIATNSAKSKDVLRKYLKMTSDLEGEEFDAVLNFRLHDFGFRGVSSTETAGFGAMAHLTNFLGTDTVLGIIYAQRHYNAKMCGFSIPATEHSTMTIGGREGELRTIKRMLEKYPTGLVACVADSYDIENHIRNYLGKEVREQILNRDGVWVVRPDSGDPIYSTYRVFNALWETFGGTVNEKGYRVLDPHVRMIQGDGIDLEMMTKILFHFEREGISTENIAFGSGGGLLQKVNRDTYKFAFKCNQAVVDGKEMDVVKRPKEWNELGEYVDSFKYSKGGNLITDDMYVVYEDGYLVHEWSWEEINS